MEGINRNRIVSRVGNVDWGGGKCFWVWIFLEKGDGFPIPLSQYGSVAGDAAAPEKAPSFVILWLPERNELFVHNPF